MTVSFSSKTIITEVHSSIFLFVIIVCRYFSYEHFYVIYCKFWELDTDHDFLIDKENLIRYGNHALTYRIVDRIFSQVCENYMFLLSLATTPTSLHFLNTRSVCLTVNPFFLYDLSHYLLKIQILTFFNIISGPEKVYQ